MRKGPRASAKSRAASLISGSSSQQVTCVSGKHSAAPAVVPEPMPITSTERASGRNSIGKYAEPNCIGMSAQFEASTLPLVRKFLIRGGASGVGFAGVDLQGQHVGVGALREVQDARALAAQLVDRRGSVQVHAQVGLGADPRAARSEDQGHGEQRRAVPVRGLARRGASAHNRATT